jgi:hypothetical protein
MIWEDGEWEEGEGAAEEDGEGLRETDGVPAGLTEVAGCRCVRTSSREAMAAARPNRTTTVRRAGR